MEVVEVLAHSPPGASFSGKGSPVLVPPTLSQAWSSQGNKFTRDPNNFAVPHPGDNFIQWLGCLVVQSLEPFAVRKAGYLTEGSGGAQEHWSNRLVDRLAVNLRTS